jgi:hypothetical protein
MKDAAIDPDQSQHHVMFTWKVSYQHIPDRDARYPFWKRTSYVNAMTRKEAIEKVQARFGPPTYGNFRASKSDKKPDLFFG